MTPATTSGPPPPELPNRPSILAMWLAASRGNPVLHRVEALIQDLSPAEIDRLLELALGSRGESSEALRWFLLHTDRLTKRGLHHARNPEDYQV